MKTAYAAVQRSAFLQMALWWLLCVGLACALALWFSEPDAATVSEVAP